MMLFRYLILGGFILISKISFAAEGCLIAGNTLYTTPGLVVSVALVGDVRTYSGPTVSISPPACPRATNIKPITGVGVLKLCIVGLTIGDIVTYDMLNPPIQCNLDDYSWALGASAAALGLIVIRKRKFF